MLNLKGRSRKWEGWRVRLLGMYPRFLEGRSGHTQHLEELVLVIRPLVIKIGLWWRFECTTLENIFSAHDKLLRLVPASLELLNGRPKHQPMNIALANEMVAIAHLTSMIGIRPPRKMRNWSPRQTPSPRDRGILFRSSQIFWPDRTPHSALETMI
jgi:hypothetical protein